GPGGTVRRTLLWSPNTIGCTSFASEVNHPATSVCGCSPFAARHSAWSVARNSETVFVLSLDCRRVQRAPSRTSVPGSVPGNPDDALVANALLDGWVAEARLRINHVRDLGEFDMK